MKRKRDIDAEYEKEYERIREVLIGQTVDIITQSMCQLIGHGSISSDRVIFRAVKGWIKSSGSCYGRSLESYLVQQLSEFAKYAPRKGKTT